MDCLLSKRFFLNSFKKYEILVLHRFLVNFCSQGKFMWKSRNNDDIISTLVTIATDFIVNDRG